MNHKHLSTYLNDHLAGSVTILELLDHIQAAYANSEVASFASALQAEILEDRRELERLMAQLKVKQSTSRKAAAWLVEKFAALKLRIDDPGANAFRLHEAMDACSTGIEGKRLLWLALAAASGPAPELRKADFDRLVQRAEDQRRRVEVVRLNAATTALSHDN